MKTRIFLTGFRGAGKSTLARLLAERLNFELLETDKIVVRQAGCPIEKIVKEGGWRLFRLLESQVLENLLKKNKIVVDCGGGLFVNDVELKDGLTFGEYNYNLVKDLPGRFIIFLKVSESVLKKRLEQDPAYNKKWRPSLGKPDIRVYYQRMPLYEKRSDFILDNSDQSPLQSLGEIMKALCGKT